MLGIGSAGGKSGKSNEGKELEGRLKEMRKARDDRAKEIEKAPKQVPVGAGMMGNNVSDGMTLDTSSMESAAASPTATVPSKPKNKKNKKKKKKKAKR